MKADEEDGKEEEGGREVQEGEEYENEIEGKLDKLGKQRKKQMWKSEKETWNTKN